LLLLVVVLGVEELAAVVVLGVILLEQLCCYQASRLGLVLAGRAVMQTQGLVLLVFSQTF
jgi:hypothetical protein